VSRLSRTEVDGALARHMIDVSDPTADLVREAYRRGLQDGKAQAVEPRHGFRWAAGRPDVCTVRGCTAPRAEHRP
jgi:hypothetical protein